MTTGRSSFFMLDGRRLGLLSFGLTLALFTGTLLIYVGAGHAFDQRAMYISDLGDIPGWTSKLYSSGMLLLVPLRVLFLLFIVSVFPLPRIHGRRTRSPPGLRRRASH